MEASPILNLLLSKGIGVKSLSEIVDSLASLNRSPDDLSIEGLVDELGLSTTLKSNALAVQEQVDSLAEQLERQNVRMLVRGFDPYPHKLTHVLGKNAPPILFAKGNLSLLTAKAVGFCGSRHASDKGIHVAAESARQLSENGVDVVSGYAKGVDLAAHCAALEAGGTTTIVLAEGILHFRPKREIKSLLNGENHVVISEYAPRLPWIARNAMQRNNTIIGLSDAIIVIESGTSGGTHACAESALRLKHPIFVTEYASPAESARGNQEFISRGARALRGDRNGRPNLTAIYETLKTNSAGDTSARIDGLPAKSIASLANVATEDSSVVSGTTPSEQPGKTRLEQNAYPKRLIEVDLPIARISAHARREKSIRHGHISTLHIWWARRPLAACRAVICAALWPDPAEPLCPQAFRVAAIDALTAFAKRVNSERISSESRELQETLSFESRGRWEAIAAGTLTFDPNEPVDMPILRFALLDFIADFANWDNSTVPAYLETSRAITQAAHEALGGEPGTRPLVVDPFAGGGSIPLEALRVGADAFASDLNPIPVLLNKVVLEYIPRYGQRLADEVRKWGQWIKEQAEEELAEFYPSQTLPLEAYHPQPKASIKRQNGGTWYLDRVERETPIAYLWARTILSEAPGQGSVPVEVPLMRSFWLAKKAGRKVALRWVRDAAGDVQTETVEVTYYEAGQPVVRTVKRPLLEIFLPKRDSEVPAGTVARGSATCPVTGYTTKVDRVRAQLKKRRGAAADARLFTVVTTLVTQRYTGRKEFFQEWNEQGRFYRLPTDADQEAFAAAAKELEQREKAWNDSANADPPSLVPNEKISLNELRRISVPIYGMERWGDLFSPRQALALTTLARLVRENGGQSGSPADAGLVEAVQTCLTLAIGRQADAGSSLSRWHLTGEKHAATFGRQALGMVWDFSEVTTTSEMTGGFPGALEWVEKVLAANSLATLSPGHIEPASATIHPLPDDSAAAVITDPPYYDAVPYAYLSDFFYVWMRRTLTDVHPALFHDDSVPKDDEIVVDRPHQLSNSIKDIAFYERELTKAFAEGRRITRPDGVATIVFASKTTSSWEAILKAVVDAGWVITASWPIDTEMATRVAAQGQARLASSVHLVCRPREDADGNITESVGEWRDVLGELPKRIHEWMPRLAAEGVVGADAIFACLGPALEIFSRYSRVEKANGEEATLREYLEFVWAAVSTEALALIFREADASGLEPDARLTAMWLWTIGGSANGNGKKKLTAEDAESAEEEEGADEEESSPRTSASSGVKGFTLEFDAARKIAQGLGVHLEQSASLVEVKGDKARLLPVAERTEYLFGKGTQAGTTAGRKKAKKQQRKLFEELSEAEAADAGWTEIKGPSPGSTVLDRVHQSMILFAANRGELLKRFLVEDGVGKDARFWKLADNLNKLYPPGTEERRWVEGVLARKKGLGL